jgi:NADH:ubiquinone oxidoreductase subunit E
LRWQNPQPIVARVCVGNCQKYGAIGVIDKVAAELGRNEALSQRAVVIGATCLNQCERGPAVEVGSADGKALLAPATVDTVVAALREM